MKWIILCTIACVLSACGGGNTTNAPANNQPSVSVPLDPAAASQVTKDMLEQMMKGNAAATREFFVQREREADAKAGDGKGLTLNMDGKMTGYEVGEPAMEGEYAVVPAKLKFKEGVPDKTYQVVLKKEDDQWRVSMAETVKRTLSGKKYK